MNMPPALWLALHALCLCAGLTIAFLGAPVFGTVLALVPVLAIVWALLPRR